MKRLKNAIINCTIQSPFLFISIICLTFLGCGEKLTRDQAKSLLIGKYSFPITIVDQLPMKINTPYSGFNYQVLEQAGLIHLSKNRYGLFGSLIQYETRLTANGNKYTIGTTYKVKDYLGEYKYYINVRLGSKTFGEVVGIFQEKGSKNARVEFTVNINNLTPFAKAYGLKIGSYLQQCSFLLYDDGWRVDPNCKLSFENIYKVIEPIYEDYPISQSQQDNQVISNYNDLNSENSFYSFINYYKQAISTGDIAKVVAYVKFPFENQNFGSMSKEDFINKMAFTKEEIQAICSTNQYIKLTENNYQIDISSFSITFERAQDGIWKWDGIYYGE